MSDICKKLAMRLDPNDIMHNWMWVLWGKIIT